MPKVNKKTVKKKNMKNDLILFVAIFAIGWIGFNLLSERFGSKAGFDASATASPMGNDLVAGVGPSMVSASTSSSAEPVTGGSELDKQQIKTMLKNRTDAWNGRNLDRYMADYRKFDYLTISIDGDTKEGWDTVYDYFASKFAPNMGTLRTNNIQTDMLGVGDMASIVKADWTLQQDGKVTSGWMNLVLNKVDSVWKITAESITERKLKSQR